MTALEEDLELLRDLSRRWSNVGRWGADDELGTLNHLTPERVRAARSLITEGRTISLALDLGPSGPQNGHLGRFNPVHLMSRTGTDVFARGGHGLPRGVGGADDLVTMPSAAATHWDALSHIFFDDAMWNGHDCRLVSTSGAERCAITSYRNRFVGRAVLLDLPRHLGVPWLEPGQSVGGDVLDACAAAEKVAIGTGDIVLLRFGQIAQCRARGAWGSYAGGDAPGLALDTLGWVAEREIAAVASDTWGVEVRPNQTPSINQPWHRVALPSLGLLVGEMFDLEELAVACDEIGRYEFFLAAAPLPIEHGVNGPVNPVVVL